MDETNDTICIYPPRGFDDLADTVVEEIKAFIQDLTAQQLLREIRPDLIQFRVLVEKTEQRKSFPEKITKNPLFTETESGSPIVLQPPQIQQLILNGSIIFFQTDDLDDLFNYVMRNYNEYLSSNRNDHLFQLPIVPGQTTREELDDKAVDTLRHNTTLVLPEFPPHDYDELLQLIELIALGWGERDDHDLYKSLVRRIHDEISCSYPFLAETCEQKNIERDVISRKSSSFLGDVYVDDKFFNFESKFQNIEKKNSFGNRVDIPEPILREMIQEYKRLKSWNLVRDSINNKYGFNYSSHIIRTRVKEFLNITDFSGLKITREDLFDFLNSRKNEILKGDFIPTKENVLKSRPDFNDLPNLNSDIWKWFQKHTKFKNLTELKQSLGRSENDILVDFLNSKKSEILNGTFIPTKENVLREKKSLSRYEYINNAIPRWLKRNTPFSGIKELKYHFKGKPAFTRITEYLDSIKSDILNGKIIPDTKYLREVKPKLEKDPDSHIAVLRWIKENTKFKTLSDLRENFEGIPISTQLWQFLDARKNQILNGDFIPDIATISAENDIFKDYATLSLIVNEWLKQHSNFSTLTEYKEHFFGIPIPTQIENILNVRKKEISIGEFIPTKMNLCEINPTVCEYSHISDVVNRWLEVNSNFSSLSELKEHFNPSRYQLGPLTERDNVWKFLDQRKKKILSGEFFPTMKNIRSEDIKIGNYRYLSKEVAKWLDDRSNGRFPTIESLVEHYDPFPNELGHYGHHGYTPNFENEKFRVLNALHQIVKIIDDNDLITLNSAETFSNVKTWGNLLKFLDKNTDWHLVDLLSGEIIEPENIYNESFAFHHLDKDKQNDDLDNLVFLLPHNHGVITQAQMYFPQLEAFFEDLLRNNLSLLGDGTIPESWETTWRVVAINHGLSLPVDKYKAKLINSSVLDRKDTLDKFL
jgi:hypothetical protein